MTTYPLVNNPVYCFPMNANRAMRNIPELRMLGMVAAMMFTATLSFAQGKCYDGYGTPSCPLSAELATAPIRPLFASTGWRTVALDHITFEMPDYQKEAAFYEALLGWKLRSDDGKQAVLDIGNWGSVILRNAPEQQSAVVKSICFVIEPWNARKVEAELRKRGLTPLADNDGKGFESFHVKDPDGWDLQISNGNGLNKSRKTPASVKPTKAVPFAPTGWKTVWLDHLSFQVTNYKESVSFYNNLLGWNPTYDEGSQHELMIGDVGDIIIRAGSWSDPNLKKTSPRKARVDHISFGISPWNSDAVKTELEKRGLQAEVDTASSDDIHVAAYKSYHTTTPNGYDLQISFVTSHDRLTLPNVVKPKALIK
jgi:catechol 2,3-dioxygenase-like lactoylglutathione lyase family enzyme